jgi:hypothetical protein
MSKIIPLDYDFKPLLESLNYLGIRALSKASSVPFHTLLKIRSGETANPGIATVCSFAPHLDAVLAIHQRKA